jgi:site-specific recombinase XerD
MLGLSMPRRTALTVTAPAPLATLPELVARANVYATDARASSTRRAYLSDFATFEAWCAQHGLEALPTAPATVAVYLSALADLGRRPSTIERALTSIAHAHRTRGHAWQKAHPQIVEIMGGIKRRLGMAPAQKAPVVVDELAALVGVLDAELAGLRDRAVLTLGWWGAFRRSELVALTVGDIARTREGLVVTLRRSKGDQEGRGLHTGVPHAQDATVCPVRALDAWLDAAQIAKGAVFRSIDKHGHVSARALGDRSVALIVQRTAERAGLDPKKLAGHSLRAGFATTAAREGRTLEPYVPLGLRPCSHEETASVTASLIERLSRAQRTRRSSASSGGK